MNGELAQVICLSGYGSSWLAKPALSDPPTLDRENSTFQFVGSLEFRLPGGPAAFELLADTVADWLRQLRDRGVARLWLVIPEAKTVTGPGSRVDEQMLAGQRRPLEPGYDRRANRRDLAGDMGCRGPVCSRSPSAGTTLLSSGCDFKRPPDQAGGR